MTTVAQQRENRRRWVEALRSGNYERTTGVLRSTTTDGDDDDDYFCCLGVCLDILAPEQWEIATTIERFRYYHHPNRRMDGEWMDDEAAEWVGLTPDQVNILASMNDEGDTFDKIADTIEELPFHGPEGTDTPPTP